jgi:hypothetical protein
MLLFLFSFQTEAYFRFITLVQLETKGAMYGMGSTTQTKAEHYCNNHSTLVYPVFSRTNARSKKNNANGSETKKWYRLVVCI